MAYVRHITLTANTVTTVTVSGTSANASAFEVLNRSGLDEVYVSHDGTAAPTDPTIGGNDFDVVPAAVGAGIQVKRSTSSQAAITVKLISASATKVSVRSLA